MAKVGHTICHMIRTLKRKIIDNKDLSPATCGLSG